MIHKFTVKLYKTGELWSELTHDCSLGVVQHMTMELWFVVTHTFGAVEWG